MAGTDFGGARMYLAISGMGAARRCPASEVQMAICPVIGQPNAGTGAGSPCQCTFL